MRSEWVPLSAASLVTGVMALVLAQMLNPGGSASSPAEQMLVAAEYPGRWLAMSVLFFGAAAALVLGAPAVLVLFSGPRGRGVGVTGVSVFVVGCVGVGGLAALMLMFRALAMEALATGDSRGAEQLVEASLENSALLLMLSLWVYGFLLGVLLIALGLLRSRRTPAWVPGLLFVFLAIQVVTSLAPEGSTLSRVAGALGLMVLAAGFTGIATNAASVRTDVVTRSLT